MNILLELAIYVLIAFAYTWILHFRIVEKHWSIDQGPGRRFYWAGLPGPLLGALGVSIASGNAKKLAESLFVWPIEPQWWLLAFLTVPATYLAATGIYFLNNKEKPTRLFRRPELGWGALLASQLYVVGSEEIGWRGIALPILSSIFGPLGGTLVLGPLWALWHLPMFRVPTSHQKGSYWRFGLNLTLWSFIMTVTVIGSGGSILPAMLFHATANVAAFTMDVPKEAERYTEIILGIITILSILLLI